MQCHYAARSVLRIKLTEFSRTSLLFHHEQRKRHQLLLPQRDRLESDSLTTVRQRSCHSLCAGGSFALRCTPLIQPRTTAMTSYDLSLSVLSAMS